MISAETASQFTRQLESWAVDGGIAYLRNHHDREASSLSKDERGQWADKACTLLRERMPKMLEDAAKAADPFGFKRVTMGGWAQFSLQADAMLVGADALREIVGKGQRE